MSENSFTVLIVEDDVSLRKTIQLALKNRDFRILEASDGEEALETFKNVKVEAILLDAVIPRLDGFEVCQRIRKLPSGSDIPILMITGLDDPESLDRAFAAGVSDFITKPLNLGLLSRRLYRLAQSRRVEGKLRQRELEFDSIFRAIPDAIIYTDPKLNILTCNPAFTSIFGYEAKEIVNGSARILYADEESYDEHVERWLNGGAEKHRLPHEVRFRRKDESRFFGETVGSKVVDDQGETVGFITIIRDITERKNTEEERVKEDKLETMGLLAGGIAHDLNNIITALMSSVSLVRMELPQGGMAAEYLGECQAALDQAMQLSQQLLTFSKGGEPIKKLIDLPKLVRSTVELALRATKSIAEYDIPEEVWHVEADEGQIVQVISNLVINADQAMPFGGTVSVAMKNAELASDNRFGLEPGSHVAISLVDHGIGIPENCIDRIFDPYFTTKKRGSGLGLATVYSVIKRHHGHIEVTSYAGEGTCFTCYLPADAEAKINNVKRYATFSRGQGRILCLEDQEIIRRGVTRLLEKEAYNVVCKEDGREAVEAYKSAYDLPEKFDLVILDMTVPGGMGGLETMKRLRKFDPRVKAIVSSGYWDDPVMANPLDYGFKGVLPKPFSREELLRVVAEVIAG